MKIDLGKIPWVSSFAIACLIEKTILFYQAHPFPLFATVTYCVTHLWYILMAASFFLGKFKIFRMYKKGQVFLLTAIVGCAALVLNKFPVVF